MQPSQTEVRSHDRVKLDPSWKARLLGEFDQGYMRDLRAFLAREKSAGKTIYPPGPEIFQALDLTPFENVKVVILGQDPYHGPGQAHGLCFSVRDGVDFPPSLQNIFRELKEDVGAPAPKSGNLSAWSRQGVLLLNAALTVERSQPLSHQKSGWEKFTDQIIHALNNERDNLVFILWGSFAQKKAEFVDTSRHFVLKSPHPSPLSSHRGFFGSKPFSKTNDYLVKKGISPIDWRL